MRLVVAALRDKPLPGHTAPLDLPLDRRVEYALDCLDCGHKREAEALEFLRKVQARVDNPHLSALITEALR